MKLTAVREGAPSWVELSTSDEAAAIDFYSQLLGWTDYAAPMPEESGGGAYHMAQIDGDNIGGIAAQQPQEVAQGVPPHWSVYMAVDDLDATLAKVGEAGGQVLMPAMDVMDIGRMSFIMDPTGAPLGLWQAKLHKGFGRYGEPGAVTWTELMTSDAAAAQAFFERVLGVEAQPLDMEGTAYTILRAGDAQNEASGLMGKTEEMASMPNVWAVYFEVEDTDASAAKASELGATILEQPTDIPPGRFAIIQDPQGAVFGIIKSNPNMAM
ncbi:MAG: VOC family protein [Dehalococcoidia bacterium]|nr:VOC family protein [Dehalococcoidia bacterium]